MDNEEESLKHEAQKAISHLFSTTQTGVLQKKTKGFFGFTVNRWNLESPLQPNEHYRLYKNGKLHFFCFGEYFLYMRLQQLSLGMDGWKEA